LTLSSNMFTARHWFKNVDIDYLLKQEIWFKMHWKSFSCNYGKIKSTKTMRTSGRSSQFLIWDIITKKIQEKQKRIICVWWKRSVLWVYASHIAWKRRVLADTLINEHKLFQSNLPMKSMSGSFFSRKNKVSWKIDFWYKKNCWPFFFTLRHSNHMQSFKITCMV
jgi:hypothetical protein